MRKAVCLIAVLVITAPALADVNFEVSASGTQVTIGYTSDPGDQVRGVALLVTCSLGNRVNSVDSIHTAFNTFIDYAYDDPCAYTVGDDGGDLRNCLARHDGPGVDTVGPAVLPTVISLGVLDESGNQAPGPQTTDNLITFTLDNTTANTLTISADTLRSETGAVGTNGDLDTNLPIWCEEGPPPKCLTPETAVNPPTHLTDPGFNYYDEWVAMGEPTCWCYATQCHGDADGSQSGNSKTGYYRVGPDELNLIINGWKVLEPTRGPGLIGSNLICADFDHQEAGNSKTGYYRIGPDDLTILLANWMMYEPTKGPGVPQDCGGTLLN
ncbi:MAG: hypothetical protein JW860_06930 [Sedimentisphaerales bacterium]|nr:hypothetical protein [Sedimentisphaerales bacterium]